MNRKTACLLVLCALAGGLPFSCAKQQTETPAGEETFLPPEDLIVSNIRESDLSLAFELENVQTRTQAGDDLYGEWELSGTVFHAFDGPAQAGEKFTCYQVFEKGIAVPEPGTRFIGSFKRTDAGKYVVQDNGYLFPYHPDMLQMFEKGAEQKNQKQ